MLGIAAVLGLGIALSVPAWSQTQRNLWIAQFTCKQPKAAPAVASIQQSDAAALQYSGLFKSITTFASEAKQPKGTWSLTATETSYAGGSTAKRILVGFGTGRAHVVMNYRLRDPGGNVVWSQKIKSEPSYWSSSGSIGAIQNQNSSVSKQSEKLIDALAKFFKSKH